MTETLQQARRPALTVHETNELTENEFVERFGDVYEHAPWIMAKVARLRPFSSRLDLYAASSMVVDLASGEQQLELLTGHPELARPDLNEGSMTAESTKEQSGAGLSELRGTAKERLNALAEDYRRKHGFPGVVCVREHPDTGSIIADLKRRLNRSTPAEFQGTLSEVKKIAWNRIRDRVTAEVPTDGYLTTHVLDTAHGTQGAGLRYDVAYVRDGHLCPLSSGRTDTDGRSPGAILSGADLAVGQYQLTFRVGEYFHGDGTDERQYLEDVPIRVVIDKTDEHYHVPLIVSKWGYTTYRGS